MAKRELIDYSIANSPKKGGAITSAGFETPDETSARARSLNSAVTANGGVMDSVDDMSSSNSPMGNAGTVDSALGNFLSSDAGNLGKNEKTIMETFAARAGIAKEGGKANRELTNNNFGESIASQLDSNAREYTNAQEGRAGFGTKTAAVKFMEDSGSKRVRDLEKQRDSAILESKVLEASRLDNLIFQEQEAITKARSSWFSSLMDIDNNSRQNDVNTRANAQEGRTASAFETPQESRQRDLDISTQQGQIESVQNLALTAPDAGITQSDTFDEAIAKYKESSTYKNNQRAGDLAIEQAEASIANTKSLTRERNNPTPVGSSVLFPSSSGKAGDAEVENGLTGAVETLDGMSGRVLNMISSQNGKEAFIATYKRETTAAGKLNALTTTVVANSPAETKTDFLKTGAALGNINQAIDLVASMKSGELGVETGIDTATGQYFMNIVGKDFDPKITQLSQLLTASIQPYRSSVTGAAWGSQETKEYENLFGSVKYSPTELLTRLRGLQDIMQRGRMNVVMDGLMPFGDTRGTSRTLSDIAYPPQNGQSRLNVMQGESGGYNTGWSFGEE